MVPSKQFQLRPWTRDDLPEMNVWWRTRNAAVGADFAFDPRTLPSGLVVEEVATGQRQAMGFLYRTDSSIAWVEWVMGNPQATAELRSGALDTLLDALALKAWGEGFQVLFTSTQLPALRDRLVKHGYAVGDEGMTQLTRRL